MEQAPAREICSLKIVSKLLSQDHHQHEMQSVQKFLLLGFSLAAWLFRS
jgi:hypothetical protein